MRRSLTRHLLAWTLGALVLVWATFIVVAYRTGQHEAAELTDGHLASVTALLLASAPGGLAATARVPPSMLDPQLKAHDYQQSMSVVVWDAAGSAVARTGAAPLPAFDMGEGFATLSLGNPPTKWRSFSRWDEGRGRKIMVLLSEQESDELAEDIAAQIAEPGLWLLPGVALVLGLAVRRGLTPLYRLSSDVDALDIRQAAPLEIASRHAELRAIAAAINTLMTRYQQALGRERALADEVAHELRTPLAAVAVQASALRVARDEASRDAAITRLERDVQRAGHVLSDVLALARASRAEWSHAAKAVDLAALAIDVVADFAPRAHATGQELWLEAPAAFSVDGHAVLLEMALRNLIENALAHTSAGTRVMVELNADEQWMQVRDDGGPGVTDPGLKLAQERTLGLGLGLGHRVVEKVASVHGATFTRVTAPDGPGHCYRISFFTGAKPMVS